MPYHHVTESCLAETIGEGGLSAEALERALEAAGFALERLRAVHKVGEAPWLALPGRRDDLEACHSLAQGYRDQCRDVLLLGTGGSSLGARSVHALADRGFGPPEGAPRLHFVENVDPDSLEALLDRVDLRDAGLLAVSKSGGTPETLGQLLVLLPRLEAAVGRAALARRAAVITQPGDSPLAALAEAYGLARLDHDPDLGGRFSVLSPVGLVPALIAGLDGAALRAGAAEVLAASLEAGRAADSAPALGAAIAVGLRHERWVTQSVVMTYADRLAAFGLWYRQLWAESLGKDGSGTTPIAARGAVDQHSQLQLYLAGPRDKLFTLVSLDTRGRGPRVDAKLAGDLGLGYLAGRSLGDLLDAMARATADTLASNGRPLRRIRLTDINEYVLGSLFMHFMLETVIAADLFGVDAFDQPAVEEGKRLARRYLEDAAQDDFGGDATT
jgi:glucose-6-phosphate isomerase